MIDNQLDRDNDDFISIRAIVDCPGGGRLVTLGAPGLMINHRGESWINPEGIDRTLEALTHRRVALLFLLAGDDDCTLGFRHMLRERVRRAGIAFITLPIVDFATPNRSWMRAWQRLSVPISKYLENNQSIALCCTYGAGRSGMIAAYLLNRLGRPLEEALSELRQQFPESVESPLQEAWLYEQSSAR
ncbi:protein-tyrosine phosphatase family protein [Pseudochrobactrum asaccharolyticum]|uniref:Dual specificity protein phosphatase-like protein n=1 Tax=Pseudochrobactrum asaccharolyticum TaxID=354351 RepID=A0A366E737_9HYPH|nr:dual specificity protein phosphatase family protein [Pseudochrobactrum asaccharolyticum]MBX8802004.1 hypothetical protein [Ochrobactrum sp. MR28]MBX8818105.1 hypothetical protein [Ochrobactrum sp. MR31]RBO97228.1 dual specificity protein phosphatase-like protein [Pseudochrobactrum asaccharolyticum]